MATWITFEDVEATWPGRFLADELNELVRQQQLRPSWNRDGESGLEVRYDRDDLAAFIAEQDTPTEGTLSRDQARVVLGSPWVDELPTRLRGRRAVQDRFLLSEAVAEKARVAALQAGI